MKKSFLSIILMVVVALAHGQQKVPLRSYLQFASQNNDVEFLFKPKWIESIEIDSTEIPIDLEGHLDAIKIAIAGSGLKIYVHEDKYVFIYPNRLEFERQGLIRDYEQKSVTQEALKVGDAEAFDPGKKYLLSGNITDESNDAIVGVNVLVDDQLATESNELGNYRMELYPGNYILKYSYVGLEEELRLLTFYTSGRVDISMFEKSSALDEVIIEGNAFEQNNGRGQVGVEKLGIEKLEKLPSFLGNVDVIKSATALPGVTVSSESSSYLNVRGGTNDQSLILMNNATIYNPGHLFGFFSVFNGDLVSSMTVYKGNIPTRYGLRSSSVLDVKMNKWTAKDLSIYGGVGLVDSNLGIKGKLLDDKLDFHVGGRISYIDWLLEVVPNKDVIQSSAQFGDLNFNTRYRLDAKNSIFLSGYYGEDFFRYSDRAIYKWSNLNAQAKWLRLMNNGWVFESEFIASSFTNTTEGIELNDEFLYQNGINEFSVKTIMNNELFEFGIDFSNFSNDIGSIEPTTNRSFVEENSIDKEHFLSVAPHINYLLKIGSWLEFNPGVRLNYFMNYGPSNVNIYEEGRAYTPNNIVNVQSFDRGETVHSQFAIEPRIGLNVPLNQHMIRASYSRVNQFLHLISNTLLINPSSVWKASDTYIPNTKIDQYSIGYQFQLNSKDITMSVDGFYKSMENLIDYRNGASLIMNPNLEQAILSADGEAYGVETLISKNGGKLSGLISYTYSRTFASIRDQLQQVEINGGNKYPYYTDRPHSIKSNLDLKLTKKWTVSTNFIYLSGAPISAPISTFEIDNILIPLFSERNSQRIPDYHRLDLVLTYKSRIRKTKKNNDRWVLTIYNLYGRENVANIFFSSQNNQPAQPFQLVNIGQMIPTITYKFEF